MRDLFLLGTTCTSWFYDVDSWKTGGRVIVVICRCHRWNMTFWSQATGGQQLFCDTELVVKPISQWLLKNVRVRRFYVSLWEKLDHMVVQGTQVPIYLIPACAQQWEEGINHNDDIMHCT